MSDWKISCDGDGEDANLASIDQEAKAFHPNPYDASVPAGRGCACGLTVGGASPRRTMTNLNLSCCFPTAHGGGVGMHRLMQRQEGREELSISSSIIAVKNQFFEFSLFGQAM